MDNGDALEAPHRCRTEPSGWVRRFAPLVAAGGPVLDLACGGGRHARFFLVRGRRVVAVDKDTSGVLDLANDPRAEVVAADLETEPGPFAPGGPLSGRRFAGVVVVDYLHRPLFGRLLEALEPGGVLIYETFARGNERFRRPRNPDFLLAGGELLELARGRLQVVAYEHGMLTEDGAPAVKQRICAVAPAAAGGEPEPPPLPAAPQP
jgi:SAM-dependent methyltransferase